MIYTGKTHVVIDNWLMTSGYDRERTRGERVISATSLLKPVKSLILSSRLEQEDIPETDLTDMAASRIGTAIHDSIERAWIDEEVRQKNMEVLNESSNVEVISEKRTSRELCGWAVTGKFDLVVNGRLADIKTTSVISYMSGSRVDDYIKQCSVYRWLNQELITDEEFDILYVFLDWARSGGYKEGYPASRVMKQSYKLMSLEDTELMIKQKLNELNEYFSEPEENIPPCSPSELWCTDSVYKYYSDKNKTGGRSLKNFKTFEEAEMFRLDRARKDPDGIVIHVPGTPRRCAYCESRFICRQGKENLLNGT